jgi:DNA-binding transcriptional LysR family regulator
MKASIPAETGKPPQAKTLGLVSSGRRLDAVSIAALRSFVTVVEVGGFSAASRQLGIAVSTVSKHIDTLEGRLHATFFLRTTRRLSLTEYGTRFYEYCREAINQVEEAVDQTFNPQEIRGRLRVVAPPAFTRCVLSPALPTFLESHPNLHVELKVTTASFDFLQNQVDVAIKTMIDQQHGGRVQEIGKAPSVLCASPAYIDRFGMPRRPAELRDHQCLLGVNSPYSERWRFKVKREIIELPIRGVFTADTGDVLRHACLHGLGISGFYMFHVRRDLETGLLVRVLEDFEPDGGSIYAVTPQNKFVPKNTSVFVDYVRSLCREL